jgi:hypothetical protein
MAPSNPLDKKTSEVQGSGRTIFTLATIIFDVIEDELQVSDALKCAGKKVDNGAARAARVATNAVSKVSVKQAQRKLGSVLLNELFAAAAA